MLNALQAHLADIYRVDPGYDVADFLITDPRVARILGAGSMTSNTDETVLMQQDDDGLSVSVFLDNEVVNRLKEQNPLETLDSRSLNDLWTVLEGISHFNYIAWSARKNRQVSLLELELQAEVDKFVATLFMAMEQEDSELAGSLHGWLFDDISFRPELSANELERYSTANRYAARYCHRLPERLARDIGKATTELRRFYRLPQRDMISYIHSQAFAQ